jgi:hypothetical protein
LGGFAIIDEWGGHFVTWDDTKIRKETAVDTK